MTKENAEALIEAKNAGKEITPELVEKAKKEPAAMIWPTVISVRRSVNNEPALKLGPFWVTEKTASEFRRALAVAKEKTADEKGNEENQAIRFIARTFLAGMNAKGEQEVAA